MRYADIVKNYYEEQIVAKDKSANTYYYIIDRWIGTLIWYKDLELPMIIVKYIGEREAAGIKQGTIRRELIILKTALNWGKKKGYIKNIPEFDIPSAPPPKENWLTPAQCHLLLESAKYEKVNEGGKYIDKYIGEEARAYIFIMTGLHTAARKQTLLDLDWEQIDLRGKRINLNPFGRVQTAKRRPIVPISAQLYEMLRKMKNKSGPLMYHSGSIQSAFYGAVKRVKMKNVTPHTLRHTFATISLQNGVNPYQVAGVMGDSLEMVLEVYGHHCPDYLQDAANLSF